MKIKKIISFIKSHTKQNWNDENAAQWILHYDRHNLISVILNGTKIVGFALARPLRNLLDYKKQYEHNSKGDIAYVDLAVAKSKAVRLELYKELLKKVGNKKWIAFKRYKTGKNVKVYKLEKFMKRFCLQGGY